MATLRFYSLLGLLLLLVAGKASAQPAAAPLETVRVQPGQPVPARRWVERPWLVPTWTNDCNNASSGGSIWNVEKCGSYPLAKHQRMFYRPFPGGGGGEMVIAGGDHPVSMPHPSDYDGTGSEVVGLNNTTAKFRIVRPFCVPNKVQPPRPDNVGWAYDAKRDRGLMVPGYMAGPGQPGAGCGEIEARGAFAIDFGATPPQWIGPDDVAGVPPPSDFGWGGDRGSSYATYSKTTDELIRLRQDGGQRVEVLHLATKKWRFLPLPGSVQPARAQVVIDDASKDGPTIYWLDAWQEAVMNAENTALTNQGKRAYLAKMNIRTGALTRILVPSQWKGQEGLADDIYLAFDTINRLVFVPNNYDMGGSPLRGLGIYHVDTGQWDWEDVPSAVIGSAWGFDESIGALVGVGKRSPPYGTFLYKYK
jgi:hypothetical protein